MALQHGLRTGNHLTLGIGNADPGIIVKFVFFQRQLGAQGGWIDIIAHQTALRQILDIVDTLLHGVIERIPHLPGQLLQPHFGFVTGIIAGELIGYRQQYQCRHHHDRRHTERYPPREAYLRPYSIFLQNRPRYFPPHVCEGDYDLFTKCVLISSMIDTETLCIPRYAPFCTPIRLTFCFIASFTFALHSF
jgi:hypothetical protein